MTKRDVLIGLLFLLFVVMTSQLVSADQAVINSQDWQDIYSAEMYQHTIGGETHYIVEESQGMDLINQYVINPKNKNILLIESKDRPVIKGYQSKLEENGFIVEKLSSARAKDTNLLLAQKILDKKDVSGFIVVDGSLGYSAVSVIPYALLSDFVVIFADKENVDKVYEIISKNKNKEVILYGHIDREVKNTLQEFNPKIINNADRYKDNIEIVKLFEEKSPKKMVYMTNGEFLEDGLFQPEFPILFVGTTNVPPQVFDYIKSSSFTTGMVIGYDLFSNALRLRKDTGLNIYLKHAQGRNGELYALNIFPLPSYKPSIKIEGVHYNAATKKLEVTFRNIGDIYTYVQTLKHDLIVGDKSVASASDEAAFFLNDKDRSTQTYDVNLNDYLKDEIKVKSDVLYGESSSQLTFLLSAENDLSVISQDDNADIDITNVVYNTRAKRFEVTISNIGTVGAFVDPQVEDVLVAGQKVTAGGEMQHINSGGNAVFNIPLELIDEDIKDNPSITVHARYGEREDGLIKSKIAILKLELTSSSSMTYIWIIVIIVILWLFFLVRKKKKEDEKNAKHKPY